MTTVKAGELVGFDGSRGFDHGCQDWAVGVVGSDGVVTITESYSCHSCWQVGHDTNHQFLPVGTRVNVETREAGENWSTDVAWDASDWWQL